MNLCLNLRIYMKSLAIEKKNEQGECLFYEISNSITI